MKKMALCMILSLVLLAGCSNAGKESTVKKEDLTSKHIIDQYPYFLNLREYNENHDKKMGYSDLDFNILPDTAKDCGEYYTVEAEFLEPIMVPGNIELGDKITVTLDKLTGETDIWTYEEAGLASENYPEDDYAYFMPDEEGNPVYVYRSSDDRVNCLAYEGTICIKKDATLEVVIAESKETVTLDLLNQGGYYNNVYFDENGYIEQLVYIGD